MKTITYFFPLFAASMILGSNVFNNALASAPDSSYRAFASLAVITYHPHNVLQESYECLVHTILPQPLTHRHTQNDEPRILTFLGGGCNRIITATVTITIGIIHSWTPKCCLIFSQQTRATSLSR